jgi:hypothetical protein
MSHNNILKFDVDPVRGGYRSVEVGYDVRVLEEHTASIFRVRESFMNIQKYMCSVLFV